MPRMKFMNIEIDNITMNEAIDEIDRLISARKNAFVVTPNVDHIVQIERGGTLAEAYKLADLILCDGKPLIWISKWYGTPIKEKISGSDLFPLLCKHAAERGYRMFFLGAAEGVAALAAKKLVAKNPKLNVCGTFSPDYGFENDEKKLEEIEKIVKNANPDILIVGLGTPKQELFITNNRERLGVPITLGLGASLDFEAGKVRRAPRWISFCGFEWLYRVFREPKRLFHRYFVDDIAIIKYAYKYRKNSVEK